MEISIHDNQILSYCVSAEKAEIRLHTFFSDHEPHEYTDIVFADVAAYYFENDNFRTIIFGVDEIDLLALYTESKELFDRGRNYGWPGPWNTSEDALLDYLNQREIKAFALSSSYGMSGWILAKTMLIVPGMRVVQ